MQVFLGRHLPTGSLVMLVVLQYPLLKKATSSASPDVPGYVFEELVTLSFSSPVMASQMVDYLCSRLSRPTIPGKLRTLKTIRQLAKRGSRALRKRLREQDEALKKAAEGGVQKDDLTGASGAKESLRLPKRFAFTSFRRRS
jgi:hypothetical protein